MNKNDLIFVEKILNDIPDIREDKIKEVKEKLNSGFYENNQDKIIDKLIEKIKRNM